MAITLRTITGDVATLLGTDLAQPQRVRVVVSTNLPAGEAPVDKANNKILLGTGVFKPATDGTFSIAGFIDSTNTTTDVNPNPATLQYRVRIEYVDDGARQRATWDSGLFSVTANADLSDIIAEQYVPPTWITTATTLLQGYVDDAETAEAGAVSAQAAAEAAAAGAGMIAAGDITGAKLLLSDVTTTATTNGALVVGSINPVNATSGARTMTLANPTAAGQVVAVAKTDSSANAVTINVTSLRANGTAGSLTLLGQHETLTLVAKADLSWWPVADHKTKAWFDARYVTAVVSGDNTTLYLNGVEL